MNAMDRWGPFATGLEPAERLARLRALRAIVHLTCGPRGEALRGKLRIAERNGDALGYAARGLDALEPLDRRRVLASYAAIHRPEAD